MNIITIELTRLDANGITHTYNVRPELLVGLVTKVIPADPEDPESVEITETYFLTGSHVFRVDQTRQEINLLIEGV